MATIGKEEVSTSIRPRFQIPARPNVENFVSGSQFNACTTSITTANNQNVWVLPKPSTIDGISATFEWDAVPLGLAGAIMDAGIATYDQLKNNPGQTIGDFISKLTDNQALLDAARKVGERGALNIGNALSEGLTTAFLNRQNISYNPNVVKAFRTPSFRSYTFGFNLVPQNRKEANDIKVGLSALRRYAAPSLPQNSVFFRYPDLFTVSIQINASNGSMILFRSTDLALTSYNITFGNNNQLVWHDDGNPTVIGVNLQFTETKLTTRENEQQTTILNV